MCPLPELPSELGVFFPLTPTLSLGERVNLRQSVGESKDVGICASRALVLPLPKGEGWGELVSRRFRRLRLSEASL
jgi:hypothetical protein